MRSSESVLQSTPAHDAPAPRWSQCATDEVLLELVGVEPRDRELPAAGTAVQVEQDGIAAVVAAQRARSAGMPPSSTLPQPRRSPARPGIARVPTGTSDQAPSPSPAAPSRSASPFAARTPQRFIAASLHPRPPLRRLRPARSAPRTASCARAQIEVHPARRARRARSPGCAPAAPRTRRAPRAAPGCAPRQKCRPWPKREVAADAARATSKRSASANSRSSRFAAPHTSRTTAPSGIVAPCSATAARRAARQRLRRRLAAQHLLDRVRDAARVVDQQLALLAGAAASRTAPFAIRFVVVSLPATISTKQKPSSSSWLSRSPSISASSSALIRSSRRSRAALVEQPRELAVDVRPRPGGRSRSASGAGRRLDHRLGPVQERLAALGRHADHARRSRGSAGGARSRPSGPPRPRRRSRRAARARSRGCAAPSRRRAAA